MGENANSVDEIFGLIKAELQSANEKYPDWPSDPLHAVAIVGEEFGELNRAVLQVVYEPEKQSFSYAESKNEAIQTAAMAIRFLMSLDRYDYSRSEQHSQYVRLLKL